MDRNAIQVYGIDDVILMENAGIAAFSVLNRHYPVCGKRSLIFCGSGNNGGDGLVIARHIHSHGGLVSVFLIGDPQKYGHAARINYDILSKFPVDITRLESLDDIGNAFEACELMVDALLGTGLTRKVEGFYRKVIEAINASGKPVLSVDIPSGINGDTGKVMGVAVKANMTVTFGLPKTGNILYPGYQYSGRLYVSNISFPLALTESDQISVAVNQPPPLLPRDPTGYKSSFGQALFIAGGSSYYGAPHLAALSFLKAGGGYSRLASPRSIVPYLGAGGSEIVFIPQEENDSGNLALSNKNALLDLAAQMDFVVLGPGISLDKEAQQLALQLTAEIDSPLLIDGDGITAICTDLSVVNKRRSPTILTPHMGEMCRITGLPINEIDTNKIPVLQKTCADLNASIVLKGAHSLIGMPNGQVWVNMTGNSGMGTAGSGDVLTGTIAAMFGLGLPLNDAVRKGVFIHGFAGDLAAEEIGEDGMTAIDILGYLPLALKSERQGFTKENTQRATGVEIV